MTDQEKKLTTADILAMARKQAAGSAPREARIYGTGRSDGKWEVRSGTRETTYDRTVHAATEETERAEIAGLCEKLLTEVAAAYRPGEWNVLYLQFTPYGGTIRGFPGRCLSKVSRSSVDDPRVDVQLTLSRMAEQYAKLPDSEQDPDGFERGHLALEDRYGALLVEAFQSDSVYPLLQQLAANQSFEIWRYCYDEPRNGKTLRVPGLKVTKRRKSGAQTKAIEELDKLSRYQGYSVVTLEKQRVTEVSLNNSTKLRNEHLVHLRHFPDLEKLFLSSTAVDDAGLEHIASLSQLRRLDLSFTQITDAGLEHLRSLPRLWNLDVKGTRVTPAGIERLKAALPMLRKVET